MFSRRLVKSAARRARFQHLVNFPRADVRRELILRRAFKVNFLRRRKCLPTFLHDRQRIIVQPAPPDGAAEISVRVVEPVKFAAPLSVRRRVGGGKGERILHVKIFRHGQFTARSFFHVRQRQLRDGLHFHQRQMARGKIRIRAQRNDGIKQILPRTAQPQRTKPAA